MFAVAILSSDSALRIALEQIARDDPSLALAGVVDTPAALLKLAEHKSIDVLLVAPPPPKGELLDLPILRDRIAMIVLLDQLDEDSELDALRSGASAVLGRAAERAEIAATINAVARGFVAVRQGTFYSLLGGAFRRDENRAQSEGEQPSLTPRELEVLAAMADGLSNKAIARRLGISVHTAKFHVASILEKLGADTRTEAVTKAAQRGIVML